MTSIFHKFIQVSASKPIESNYFLEFAFMDQQIRKSYKQLKNVKGVERPCQQFMDYWKQIGNMGREEQVSVYFRWIELLERSLKPIFHPELKVRENDLYIKKSLISKWQIKKVRLSGCILQIFSKRLKEFPLKCFAIRKSKNKDHFSWVMEVVAQIQGSKYKMKSFHMGSNNVNEYQQWYRDIETRIDIARIDCFREGIDYERKTQMMPKGSIRKREKSNQFSDHKVRLKTLTELVIDKQLKNIEEVEGLTVLEAVEHQQIKEEDIHPNIFTKIFPKHDLTTFCQIPTNGELLECQKQYSLYQLDGVFKIFITFGRSLSVVFRAISQSHKNWNPEINTFNIKNNIGSENSVFIYQKDKSKGFLYRERDYFFLRHCFTIQPENKKEKMFMIEKSIDSIHNPPFMTVARGQKELIWCVVGTREEKESMLIVEGIIRGGGYMNASHDKQGTIKEFKRLLQLDNYLKQLQVAKISKDGYLFRENWIVSFKEQQNLISQIEQDEDEFYSPREITSDQFEKSNLEKLTKRQSLEQDKIIRAEEQSEYREFILETTKENIEKENDQPQHDNDKKPTNQDNPPFISIDEFVDQYIAPDFNEDRSVKIPTKYLSKHHQLSPKPKGKPLFVEKYRGHHLWKGQWAVAETGGLNYIDQQKMRQQKKVLTFIIKRIGKNILSGKGILNVSLPVDIFCRESNIQRLAMSFGYFPVYLEKVADADPVQQLKAIMAAGIGSSHIYLTMEKPFNPILGETYQCWIDGCPVYFEQISHHPPIAAYLMKGRGYEIYGSVQAKMEISINSGTGINEGIFTIKFDNGRKFNFTTPPGQLSGLTYGERKLCLVDKAYYWSIQEGLFLELVVNPQSKQSRFFSNAKTYVGEQKLADFFQGTLRKYNPDDLKEFLTPKKKDSSRSMIIPKSIPPQQPLSQIAKVSGRWTKYVIFGNQKIFDVENCIHLKGYDEKHPLPSHSNFREDIVYRRLNQIVLSQEWKQNLQIKQRKDRKFRQDFAKKKK